MLASKDGTRMPNLIIMGTRAFRKCLAWARDNREFTQNVGTRYSRALVDFGVQVVEFMGASIMEAAACADLGAPGGGDVYFLNTDVVQFRVNRNLDMATWGMEHVVGSDKNVQSWLLGTCLQVERPNLCGRLAELTE
jgi:hypothetical protein